MLATEQEWAKLGKEIRQDCVDALNALREGGISTLARMGLPLRKCSIYDYPIVHHLASNKLSNYHNLK